jgi:hypothetical protein
MSWMILMMRMRMMMRMVMIRGRVEGRRGLGCWVRIGKPVVGNSNSSRNRSSSRRRSNGLTPRGGR